MIVFYRDGNLHAMREATDQKFGTRESLFWYNLRKTLSSLGYDVVKRRMADDGNMVCEGVYYVRDRKKRWCVYDSCYALRSVSEEFDSHGEVVLSIQGEMLP